MTHPYRDTIEQTPAASGSGQFPRLSGESLRLVAQQYHIDVPAEASDDDLRQAILDVMRPGTNGFSQYP